MRVVYHCVSGLLEHVPMEIEALSQKADLHVVFEVPPRAWRHNLLDLPFPPLGPGFHRGEEFLRRRLPLNAWKYFEKTAGVYFAIYPDRWSSHVLTSMMSIVKGVRRIAPDILHLDGESIRAACWAPWMGIPVVINVHEPVVPMGSNSSWDAMAKAVLVPRASRTVVHSKECHKALLHRWPVQTGKVTVVPLGTMDLFKAWAPAAEVLEEDRGTVLFWGWLSSRKGIDVLLSAAPLVAESVADVRFVLAGKPVHGYRLPPIPDLANGGSVEVVSKRLTNLELARMIQEAAIVVAPYRDAMQSGVVLTAYAFGKPVVASDAGGVPEQVWHGKTGLLFESGNANAMAAAIIELLASSDLRREMRRNITGLASSKLSWERFGEAVSEVWEKVLCEE